MYSSLFDMLHMLFQVEGHGVVSVVGVFYHEGNFVSIFFVHRDLDVSGVCAPECQKFVVDKVIYHLVDIAEWIQIFGRRPIEVGVINTHFPFL